MLWEFQKPIDTTERHAVLSLSLSLFPYIGGEQNWFGEPPLTGIDVIYIVLG